MKALRTCPCAIPITATAVLLFLLWTGKSYAEAAEGQVCDIVADSALSLEDYPTAIALHRTFLQAHPDNALAHYHLGFAYGMTGRSGEEIHEYRNAASLGLRVWDLFLDMGLA